VLVFVLVAKVGEEATGAGGWGTNATAATSTAMAMDTVAAALPVDHCE